MSGLTKGRITLLTLDWIELMWDSKAVTLEVTLEPYQLALIVSCRLFIFFFNLKNRFWMCMVDFVWVYISALENIQNQQYFSRKKILMTFWT